LLLQDVFAGGKMHLADLKMTTDLMQGFLVYLCVQFAWGLGPVL